MKPGSIAVKYGVITALIIVVIDALLQVAGLGMKPGYASIETGVLVVGVLACCINFSKANGGYVTFGQTFVSGLFMALLTAGIVAVWTALKFMIWPEMRDLILQEASRQVDQNGDASEQQREMALKMARTFSSPGIVAVMSFLSMAFTGTIIALIGGAVAKKNGARPEILDQPDTYAK